MKKNLLVISALCIGISGVSQASLIDRGAGMIYDDVLDVTWLQDANYAQTSGFDVDGKMSWADALSWTDNLIFEGYDDWRLPTVIPLNGTSFQNSYSFDGTTDLGYNISNTSSELGYMFYENLGNTGYFDAAGVATNCSPCLTNTGLFNNINTFGFWFGQEFASTLALAMEFSTEGGLQNRLDKSNEFYAWAVRSGDVSTVPVPSAVWLFGTGLAGFVSLRRKQ
jgi:hypothetical protein